MCVCGQLLASANNLAGPSNVSLRAGDQPRNGRSRRQQIRCIQNSDDRRAAALRIGVNALYLIPGGRGTGYLQPAGGAGEIDRINRYVVFTNAKRVRARPAVESDSAPSTCAR